MLLLMAASGRLYGALLVLYPKAFRRRYEAEMRRDFRELSREGLQEGGSTELMRVWVQAISDLVLTALKERGTLLASRYASYSSVDPRIAKRAAARALFVVVLVAMAVTGHSLLQAPTYETSAQVLVGQKQDERLPYLTRSGEEIQPLPSLGQLQTVILGMTLAIDSRPVAQEAIQRLGLQMDPAELLNKLTVEQVENTSSIVLTYQGNDPVEATKIVNTVGQVSSEFISERSAAGSKVTATVWEKAAVPAAPVSPRPLRNGLLTLVIGLVLCVGTVVALPGVGARVAGTLGELPSRQGIGQAGVLRRQRRDRSIVERVKEEKLLLALGRRGKLTAVEAALETSLSVEEAERMLFELAAKGHLEVTVEHGRLLYSFWGHDAP